MQTRIAHGGQRVEAVLIGAGRDDVAVELRPGVEVVIIGGEAGLDEALRRAGISPGLVRMSIGYTGSVEQRWKQMADALAQLG